VTTLCQIDGVDTVSFTVDGQPIVDADGNQIGAMTEDSFIIDFTNRVKMDQSADLTLYYASKDGNSLVQEKREVEYNSNTPLAKVVLAELMKDPQTEDAHPAISSDVNVTGYALSEGICYLTLDAGIQNQSINVSDEVAIYAIVNSLIELDSINKVQITVEGESESAVQTSQLSGLYEKNMNMVSQFVEEDVNEE
jgi:germination protein M